MDQTTLYCFYDLAESPASYDFFTYMQLAELHRKRHNLSNLFFIFVPGPKNGFRDDDLSKNTAQRYAIMRNVIIPSCWLLPSCKGIAWLQHRDEANLFFEKANGRVFPRNHIPQTTIVADYTWPGLVAAYLRNETFTTLRESPEYSKMVSSLFPDTVGKKLITITIREAPYNTKRNTNFQAWLSFLKTLDSSKYKIVIIPDTNNLSNDVFGGFEYCRLASVNVLFRAAIYRKAYLNMFQNNGPVLVALLSNSPLLVVHQVHHSDFACTEDYFHRVAAIDPYKHHQYAMWKKNQRIVWQPDTADVLEKAFNTYVEEFPEKPALPAEEHGFQSDHHKQLSCQVAFEYVKVKSFVQLQQEDIDTLKAIVSLMPNFVDPKYMLGIIAGKYGKFNTAIQLFDDCINLIGTKFHTCSDTGSDFHKTFCQSKAEALEKANRFDDALNEYIEINKRYPNDNHILEKISSLKKS